MAVDLEDLIEVLAREVSPPGTNLFPNATDDEFVGNLRDAFWEARLFGFFEGFTEFEGLVTPISGAVDMTRDSQQLIVLFAGARVLRNELRNLNTMFRAVAGPVEFEQQKSAQLLVSLLQDMRSRIVYLVQNFGVANNTYYIDAVIGREMSLEYGAIEFTSGSNASHHNWGW